MLVGWEKCFGCLFYPPPPLRSSPCLSGTKRVIVFSLVFFILSLWDREGDSFLISFLPLRQGAKKVFRRSSKSASVPFEGRTLQYDVRTTPQGGGGGGR